jgi:hypothetical protein
VTSVVGKNENHLSTIYYYSVKNCLIINNNLLPGLYRAELTPGDLHTVLHIKNNVISVVIRNSFL